MAVGLSVRELHYVCSGDAGDRYKTNCCRPNNIDPSPMRLKTTVKTSANNYLYYYYYPKKSNHEIYNGKTRSRRAWRLRVRFDPHYYYLHHNPNADLTGFDPISDAVAVSVPS